MTRTTTGMTTGTAPGGDTLVERCLPLVRDVPDWPTAGVTFKDITPLLADGAAFAAVVDHLAAGRPRARRRRPRRRDGGAGVHPRRPGRDRARRGVRPGAQGRQATRALALAASYSLEYGDAAIELHPSTIAPGARVLVLDDVLATGGTAAATAELVERAGGVVVGLAFLLELTALAGRDRLPGRTVESLLATG